MATEIKGKASILERFLWIIAVIWCVQRLDQFRRKLIYRNPGLMVFGTASTTHHRQFPFWDPLLFAWRLLDGHFGRQSLTSMSLGGGEKSPDAMGKNSASAESADNVTSLSSIARAIVTRSGAFYQHLKDGALGQELAKAEEGFIHGLDRLNELRRLIPYSDLVLTAFGTAIIVLGLHNGMRRFRTATEIPLQYYRDGKKLNGVALSVNDSDNLRFYHKPLFSFYIPKLTRQGSPFKRAWRTA